MVKSTVLTHEKKLRKLTQNTELPSTSTDNDLLETDEEMFRYGICLDMDCNTLSNRLL